MDEDDGQEKKRPSLRPEIVIDPQFRDLMEPLTIEEYAQHKANIERDGQREPCVVRESDDGQTLTMIEGHHRHRANQELGRETKYVIMAFDDDAHAKRWILAQHEGRRNSTVAQFKKVLAALDAADEKRRAAAARRAAGRAPDEPYPDSRVSPGERNPTVNQQIAEVLGVTRNVVDQAANIQKHPDLAEKVKSGETTLASAAKEAKGRKKPRNNDPPRRPQLGKTATQKKGPTPKARAREIGKAIEALDISLERLKKKFGVYWDNPFDLDDAVRDPIRPDLKKLEKKMDEYVDKLGSISFDG